MFRDTITHWLSNASGENKIEVIVSVDDNDPQLENYKRAIDFLPHGILLLVLEQHNPVTSSNTYGNHQHQHQTHIKTYTIL